MSKHYVLVDEEQGLPMEWSTSPHRKGKPGLRFELPIDMDPAKMFWRDGTWYLLPSSRPSFDHKFDPAKGRWIDMRPAEDVAESDRRAFSKLVNAERSRRILEGVEILLSDTDRPVALQGREEDWRSLTDLCTNAQLQLGLGDDEPIPFRDRDNEIHQLKPHQVIELWQRGNAWVSAVRQASWRIKEMKPYPQDVSVDALWVSEPKSTETNIQPNGENNGDQVEISNRP